MQTPPTMPTANVDVADIPDHRGQPRVGDVEFFALPPAEIGRLLSAESTLPPGKDGNPLSVRILMACAAAAALDAVLLGLAWAAGTGDLRITLQTLSFVLPIMAIVVVLLVTRFNARCSYVGEKGAACFTLKGRRAAMPRTEIVLFEPAAELRATTVRHLINGVYSHTSYDYSWSDQTGRRLCLLKGTHKGNRKAPKPGDKFHFVRAAELAWSRHFLNRANQLLQTEGSIPFRVDKSRWIRIGPGFLEFHFGGQPVRVTKPEIASVTLGSGRFSFKHKDAKWFSLAGKYSFNYGSMANAQVFLFALESLMGYRWA